MRSFTKHSSVALAVAVGLTLTVSALPARAEGPDAGAALFHKGRKLMQEPGKLAEACQILAESYKLAERGDTLLNLAECHRREGKTATAWSEFDSAIKAANQVGFTQAIEVAKQLRDELAAKLSELVVTVSPETAALEGLVVELDGKPLPRAQWNKPLALDPGPREVTAEAKGRQRFVARVALGAEKDRKALEVTLERVPEAPKPPPPPPAPPPPPKPLAKPRPIWPWIVGGGGVALAGAAVAFAVDQRSAGQTLDDKCGGAARTRCGSFDFASTRSRELRGFQLSMVMGIAGGVAVGAGALGLGLDLSSRRRPQSAWLSVGPGSLDLQGTF